MKTSRRVGFAGLAASVVIACLAGCGGGRTTSTTQPAPKPAASQPPPTEKAVANVCLEMVKELKGVYQHDNTGPAQFVRQEFERTAFDSSKSVAVAQHRIERLHLPDAASRVGALERASAQFRSLAHAASVDQTRPVSRAQLKALDARYERAQRDVLQACLPPS